MADFDGDGTLGTADADLFWQRASVPRGDLDGDGLVTGADLGLLLGAWGAAGVPADLDLSGSVGGADLGVLLGNWSN
jgi:hypothetical protein